MKKVKQLTGKTSYGLLLIAMAILMMLSADAMAQVAINKDGSQPANSAMLDVKASDGGLLIPRMTAAQRDAISSPATGLMVYVTGDNKFWYYDGTQWVNWVDAADNDWTVSGNDVYSTVSGNVGIGTVNPDQKLEVSGGGVQLNGEYGIGFIGDIPYDGSVSGDKAKIYYDGDFLGSYADYLVIEKTDGNTTNPDGGIAFTNKGSDNVREVSMIIKGDGNVGVGTTSPSTKLDVNGQIRIRGGSPEAGKVLTSDANGLASWTDASSAVFNTTNIGSVSAGHWYRIASNPGNRADASFTLRDMISGGGHSTVRFHAGVNYGDGGGISFSLLSHSKYGGVTFTKVRIIEKGTYDGAYLEVYCNRSGTVECTIYDNEQSAGWTPADWTAGSVPSGWTAHEYEINNLFAIGANDDVLTVQRNGNVGIGKTNPRRPLDVAGEIVATNRITMTTDGTTTSPTWHMDNNSDRYRIFRQPNINTSGTEFFTIRNSGNVGIGTNNPGSYRLSVSGGGGLLVQKPSWAVANFHTTSSNSRAIIRVKGNGGDTYGYSGIDFGRTDATSYWAFEYGKSSDRTNSLTAWYYNGSNWKRSFSAWPDGTFGSWGLDQREWRVRQAIEGSNYLECYAQDEGGLVGINYWNSSLKMKKNIEPLIQNSELLYDLDIYSYNYKTDPEGAPKTMGIIAEYADKVLPSIVAYDSEGEVHHVNYGLMSVLMLDQQQKHEKEIKELQQEIKELKVLVKQLTK